MCRFLNARGNGQISDAIDCMRLCRREGAYITTNSYSTTSFSRSLQNEIQVRVYLVLLHLLAAEGENCRRPVGHAHQLSLRVQLRLLYPCATFLRVPLGHVLLLGPWPAFPAASVDLHSCPLTVAWPRLQSLPQAPRGCLTCSVVHPMTPPWCCTLQGGPLQAASTEQGLLVVAAAGNKYSNLEVRPEYPAALRLDNVISVGSTDPSDALSDFSNYGT